MSSVSICAGGNEHTAEKNESWKETKLLLLGTMMAKSFIYESSTYSWPVKLSTSLSFFSRQINSDDTSGPSMSTE
jgi:hypothetical protein